MGFVDIIFVLKIEKMNIRIRKLVLLTLLAEN